MSWSATVTWNGDALISALQQSAEEAGLLTVEQMVETAQSFAPVLTGLLQSSIQVFKKTHPEWSFGSDVRYALWVEIGSQGRAGQYYLTRAAEANKHLFFVHFARALRSKGW